MKCWEINIPIYNKLIVLIQADSIKDIDEYVEYYAHQPLEKLGTATQIGAASYGNLPGDLLFLGVTPSYSLQELVHECGHMAWQIFEMIGGRDEEAFCYLLDYIFGKVHSCLTNIEDGNV